MELAVGRGDGTEVNAPPPFLVCHFISVLSEKPRKLRVVLPRQARDYCTIITGRIDKKPETAAVSFRFVSCFVFRTVCLLCLSVGNTTVDAALPFASGLPEISRCQPNPGAIRQRDDVDEPAVCRRYCLAQTQPAVFKMKRLCCFFLWGRNRRVSVLVSFYSFCFILFRFILFCFVSFLFRIGRSY
jgi:hypothetical protein